MSKIIQGRNCAVAMTGFLALAGCGSSPKTETKAAAAAKVEGAVKEPELARITLTPEAEKRLGIGLAPVEYRPVSRTQVFGGETIPASGGTWEASAPFAGTIVAPEGGIPATGAMLRKGQAVLRLLPLGNSTGDMRVEAEREAAAAEARLEAARARQKRAEQLLADRAGSVRSVEESREQVKIAEADASAAKARLARAKMSTTDAVGGLVLAASQDGVLQKVLITAGQAVPAGALLFEVTGTNPLWVRVPVYAGAAGSLVRGRSAHVQKLGDRAGAGAEARAISAPVAGDPSAATVDLYFELANANGAYRPGERVNVALAVAGEEKGLVVPWAAVLFDIHGGTWVYEMIAQHVYARRRVEVRYVAGPSAFLSRGPSAGAKVVTTGAAELFGTEFSTGK